jgi:hypothetical protein
MLSAGWTRELLGVELQAARLDRLGGTDELFGVHQPASFISAGRRWAFSLVRFSQGLTMTST